MTEPTASVPTAGRPAGIVLVVLGVASLGLLLNHPSPSAQTFADVLRGEAANRTTDAVVHGGFIAILGAQLVCLAILAIRIGIHRASVIAAYLLTAIGAAALMLSMGLDGLVTPAIAARYVDVVEHHNDARTIFVLLGTLIRFLMPAGLLFVAIGLVFWGAALRERETLVRVVRWFGAVTGVLIIAGIATTAGMVPHVLMIAILAIALWDVLVGLALTLRRI